MSTTSQPGRPIVAGVEWRLRLAVTSSVPFFPSGATHTAQVRDVIDAGAVRHTLTTANGGIVRVNDTTCDLVIPGAVTAAWKMASVVLDLMRTDTDPDVYGGFILTVPVTRPVTRL